MTEDQEQTLVETVKETASRSLELAKSMDQFTEVYNNQMKVLDEWVNQVQTVIDNHGRRLSVIEALFTHPDLAEERRKFAANELSMDDFVKVLQEIVVPQLRAQFQAMLDHAKKERDAAAAGEPQIVVPGPKPGTVLGPDGNPASGNVVRFPGN